MAWVSPAATAGTLLYHPGLWGLPDSLCSRGIAVLAARDGCELPWGPRGMASAVAPVHAGVGSLQKLCQFVPGCLSLCHSLKGSSLSSLGARCLLTAPLGCCQLPGCLPPSQARHLLRQRGGRRLQLEGFSPGGATPEPAERAGDAETHGDILGLPLKTFKRFRGHFAALLCPDGSGTELIPGDILLSPWLRLAKQRLLGSVQLGSEGTGERPYVLWFGLGILGVFFEEL